MRPSTIVLAAITVVFGAATIVLAVLIGTDEGRALSTELRLSILITFGFGVACVTTEVNHRRRARLQQKAEIHPGTAFVTAHATESTAADLAAWSPRLRVWFPCDLGFDRTGITSWSTRNDGQGTPTAHRSEVLGFDVFSEPTPRGVAQMGDRGPPCTQNIGARSGPPVGGRQPAGARRVFDAPDDQPDRVRARHGPLTKPVRYRRLRAMGATARGSQPVRKRIVDRTRWKL
ncbi:MAG: hypothetical protein DI639_05345 [Leifsonia xyli]|nr:MAG: hypothetical protein DI639_05345 [Leifsonia xyli]